MIKNNDIKLYYKVIGEGFPLMMLHGNGEDHHSLLTLAQSLASDFKIYLIDSRGHGQSEGKVAKDYQEMAVDLITFMNQHDIYECHIFGYSDGGIVALKTAIIQPKKFVKIVLCGVNISPDGIEDITRKSMADAYSKNKNPLLALMLEGPIFNHDDFKKINHPTQLYFGEHDVIKTSHQQTILNLLKHASLHILASETHESYIMNNDMLANRIRHFLK